MTDVPVEPGWRRVGDTDGPPGDLRRQADTARHRAAALRAGAETFQAALTDPEQQADPNLVKQLLEMHAEAEDFFQAQLPRGGAQRYLAERGIDPATQQRWSIGYAPGGWRTLTDHLRSRGYSDEAIVAGGLAKTRRDGSDIFDLFRDRAIFPIRDENGLTRGFIGRAAPRSKEAQTDKYLNTPDGPIFHKDQLLFGLAEARAALAAGARPVIVEGPLDAIAVSRAAPLRYAGMALCGTRLSSHHVAALSRTAPPGAGVLTALDSDNAGRAGMIAAYPLLAALTRTSGQGTIDAASLPAGVDPAEILRSQSPAALADVLDQTRPLADLVINDVLERWDNGFTEGKLAGLRASAEALIDMPRHEVLRQTSRLAERLELPYQLVAETIVDTITNADNAPKRVARLARDLDGGPGPNPTSPQTHPAVTAIRTAFPKPIKATTKQRGSRHGAPAPPTRSAPRGPAPER